MRKAISFLTIGFVLSFSVLAQGQDVISSGDPPAEQLLLTSLNRLREPIYNTTYQSGKTVQFPEWPALPEEPSRAGQKTNRLVMALIGFGLLGAGGFLASTSRTRLVRGEGIPHCSQISVEVGGPVGSTQTGGDWRQIDQQRFCPNGRPPARLKQGRFMVGTGLIGAGVTMMIFGLRK